MTKRELRETYLQRRKALSSADIANASDQISTKLFESFDLASIKTLHCFTTIKKLNEIDTSVIFSRLWNEFTHVATVVPRVDFASGEIESVRFSAGSAMTRNIWSIDEPSAGELIPPNQIDMVLAPGLVFDRNGHRVGYGKGFYDRFLNKCRPDCIKIGLSFFEPIERIIDSFAGDVRLDAIIAPTDTFAMALQSDS